jgi:hypothetical protein
MWREHRCWSLQAQMRLWRMFALLIGKLSGRLMLSRLNRANRSGGGDIAKRILASGFGVLATLALASRAVPAPPQQPSAAPGAAKNVAALPPDAPGVPQRMRLMSQDQYVNSLAYIFGPDLPVDARFATPQRVDGLDANSAAFAGVTAAQLGRYQRTAFAVSRAVVDPQHRDFLIACKPKDERAADAACATKFLAMTGRLLYRRPLSQEKLAAVVAEANAGADKLGSFYLGVAAALEGMLFSPEVLFVTDSYETDPNNKSKQRLDSYSLAQRLSFFLWDAAPDDALLKAAETGEIQTTKGRARIVDMMLASPRLEAGMRAFFDDMMGFDDFNNLAKDGTIYPDFISLTAADAREQTLRTIIDHLLIKQRDYRDLYTTRNTFISPALAPIYGLPVAQDWTGWVPYQFPDDSERAGIVTDVSFLALHSHPGRSSPTLRGKALREVLLCETVPKAPGNVDFSKVENPDVTLPTMRQRLTAHRSNPVCAGCHRLTDPIGLSLENFDGAGQFRTTEKGAPIDASGSLDGESFNNPIGLAHALHDDPALPTCLVRRMYSYATGGPTTSDDAPVLNYLNASFAAHGYRVPDLVRTIALSPTFAEVVPPASPAPVQKTAAAATTVSVNGP